MGDWKYCNDELPEEDGEYLVVWCTANNPHRKFYEIQEYSDGEWWVNIPQAGNDLVIIEAWLELPALPKEGE